MVSGIDGTCSARAIDSNDPSGRLRAAVGQRSAIVRTHAAPHGSQRHQERVRRVRVDGVLCSCHGWMGRTRGRVNRMSGSGRTIHRGRVPETALPSHARSGRRRGARFPSAFAAWWCPGRSSWSGSCAWHASSHPARGPRGLCWSPPAAGGPRGAWTRRAAEGAAHREESSMREESLGEESLIDHGRGGGAVPSSRSLSLIGACRLRCGCPAGAPSPHVTKCL
jgi:hypothetical protein